VQLRGHTDTPIVPLLHPKRKKNALGATCTHKNPPVSMRAAPAKHDPKIANPGTHANAVATLDWDAVVVAIVRASVNVAALVDVLGASVDVAALVDVLGAAIVLVELDAAVVLVELAASVEPDVEASVLVEAGLVLVVCATAELVVWAVVAVEVVLL
jgi:hypothetical protein